MEIGKYEQVCLTKPPCFNTLRFLNLRVLKHEDSKISMFKPQRFLNLHVLKHGDSKFSMFRNTAIKFCIKKFKIPILNCYRRKKTKFIEKKFQQHAITYTGH